MKKEILDDLDKGIVRLLSRDGRMSFTEVAERLNVTEKTIRSRYKTLIEEEILTITGVVNPVSIGIKVVALIQLGVEPKQLENVRRQLVDFPNVRFVTLTSGDYQLMIQNYHKTYEELTSFIRELNEIEGINRTNVMVQFEVYKNTFEYL